MHVMMNDIRYKQLRLRSHWLCITSSQKER